MKRGKEPLCLPRNVAMSRTMRLVHLDLKKCRKTLEKTEKIEEKRLKRLSEMQLRSRPFCLLLFALREKPPFAILHLCSPSTLASLVTGRTMMELAPSQLMPSS